MKQEQGNDVVCFRNHSYYCRVAYLSRQLFGTKIPLSPSSEDSRERPRNSEKGDVWRLISQELWRRMVAHLFKLMRKQCHSIFRQYRGIKIDEKLIVTLPLGIELRGDGEFPLDLGLRASHENKSKIKWG